MAEHLAAVVAGLACIEKVYCCIFYDVRVSIGISRAKGLVLNFVNFLFFQLFDKEIKKTSANVPLEFEQVRGLFGKKNDIIAEHFALD